MLNPSLDFGDAADDMTAATILLLVGGQLVLLTPRKVCPIFLVKEDNLLTHRCEFRTLQEM
jgi:hypothetical protein